VLKWGTEFSEFIPRLSKGNPVNILEPRCGFPSGSLGGPAKDGNISELGDIGMGPGKSSLFFLTSLSWLSLKFWIAQS
jgi:hypothetical protein